MGFTDGTEHLLGTPMDLQKAFDRAKAQLMSNPESTFICSIFFSMEHKWDSSIPTACTDGRTIWFNPESFMDLTEPQRVSRCAHETWHIALDHLVRCGERDQKKFNYAADIVINNMLIDAGFMPIPTWVIRREFNGLSTEQVYDQLPDDEEYPEVDDLMLNQAEDKTEYKQFLDSVISQAVMAAQMAGDDPGKLPGDVQLYIKNLTKPKLPWNRIVQRYVRALVKKDYSYRKPNRRYFPDLIAPTAYSETIENAAVLIDVSGSVHDYQFKQFASEIHSLLKSVKPEKISVVHFDYIIREVDVVRSTKDLMKVQFTGRGGTRISPAIDWINENKPTFAVIFTDGYFNNYTDKPKIPIIWVIIDNPGYEARYGKVIHFQSRPE